MWTLSVSIFWACKWITWRAAGIGRAPRARQAAYLFGWAGMDAPAFLGSARVRTPGIDEWRRGTAMLVTGAALFFGVARLAGIARPVLAGWIGTVGLALALHFGLFQLLSCAWRRAGVDAAPLMRQPARSASLGEFWGRRWNTAFRDLTHRFVFRPLAPRLGVPAALLTAFISSGLLHDVVISWPAGGGFGGPTVFFAVQGLGILGERSRVGRRAGLGGGWRGRAFAAAMLALPLPLLFHVPFVTRIVVPFMDAVGAL
jgi:alginate O-acetyltransferase complex protein AlgI